MNVSSIIIKVQPDKAELVLKQLTDLCEVHHIEENKIIATIEQESIGEEVKMVRAIEKVEGVTSVQMAFSYSENELEKIKNDVELQGDTPEWLNDDSVTAKQINYQGDLKKKF